MGYSVCGRYSCNPLAGPSGWQYSIADSIGYLCGFLMNTMVGWSAFFLSGSWISGIHPLYLLLRQHAWLRLFPQGPYQASKTCTFTLAWEEGQPSLKAATCVFSHQMGQFQPQHLTFRIVIGKTLMFLETCIKLSK